jgi:transcription antitermination factor NusG
MEEKILKEGMNWYAVRTMNNVENKVKERIIKEIESNNLTNLVSQIMVPTEKILSSKNGKKILKVLNIMLLYLTIGIRFIYLRRIGGIKYIIHIHHQQVSKCQM